MYIYLHLTPTKYYNNNDIICTHENIHKIYNIHIYTICTYTLCVHEHIPIKL